MDKTLDTTLHKSILFYEDEQLKKYNIKKSRDGSRTFSNNLKPGFKIPPSIKLNNTFLTNRKFNKTSTKPKFPGPNTNRQAENRGAKATPLYVSCWKCQGHHYARYYLNNIVGVLHYLLEDPMVEYMASTPRIYATLDG